MTLTGQPGQPEPVLDLDFANSVIELCSTCVFTLRNITVKNERRGRPPTSSRMFTQQALMSLPGLI